MIEIGAVASDCKNEAADEVKRFVSWTIRWSQLSMSLCCKHKNDSSTILPNPRFYLQKEKLAIIQVVI